MPNGKCYVAYNLMAISKNDEGLPKSQTAMHAISHNGSILEMVQERLLLQI